MNYSYVMGVEDISFLENNDFKIEAFGNSYGVSFNDDKIDLFEKFIYDNLKPGFWNEYLGKDKVFIFKYKDGKVEKYILDKENESLVLNLCNEFANSNFISIDIMLKDNTFYSKTYYS